MGNLQRFLLALDVLTAEKSGPAARSAQQELDPHLAAYLARSAGARSTPDWSRTLLAREGFRIVGVPSTSEGARSINPINGVHAPGVYYMPA